jgi:hypothetical protein
MYDALIAWLNIFLDWLVAHLLAMFGDFINLVMDLFIWIIDQLFYLILLVIALIPAPDLLAGITMHSLAIQLPISILWVMEILRINECLTMIVSAHVFYFLRRLMTLGHW